MHRRVACSEGEGSTTVAACLANEYARSGARTILVDSCADSRTLSQELAAGTTTKDGAEGAAGVRTCGRVRVLLHWHCCRLPKVTLQPGETNRLLIERMTEVLAESRLEFERIIVDLPALLSSDHWKPLIPYVDQVIVVVDFGKTTVDQKQTTA